MALPERPLRADVRRLFEPDRVWIMGVVNITPDSFYEGSRVSSAESASARAGTFLTQGADCIDLGAESTRPGAVGVSTAEELGRLLPVVQSVHAAHPHAILSIDTQKADVARRCLKAGAGIINDVSALRHDSQMAQVVAESDAVVVLMHMQGTPLSMQNAPRYDDVVGEIKQFFEERVSVAEQAGVRRDQIILDPGIGFGKTIEHNLEILRRLRELVALGFPILIGASRKTFLGRIAADPGAAPLAPQDRLEASLAAGLWSVEQGAQGLRVHDVDATRRVVRTWQRLRCSEDIPVS